MTPEQFTTIQQALGHNNAQMAAEIGLSERMVAYMKAGQKQITPTTAGCTKDAIKRKIDDLKVLHKCIK
jgi:hypothetical protein